MKIELKHIAPYLPYKIKCLYTHTNDIGVISNVYTIGEGYDDDDLKISFDCGYGEHIWMFKPILRPISDITKEIEHNGKRFVPIECIRKKYSGFYFEYGDSLLIKSKNTNLYISTNWVSEIHQNLFQWHFDVFGLIDKGLAVTIKALEGEE